MQISNISIFGLISSLYIFLDIIFYKVKEYANLEIMSNNIIYVVLLIILLVSVFKLKSPIGQMNRKFLSISFISGIAVAFLSMIINLSFLNFASNFYTFENFFMQNPGDNLLVGIIIGTAFCLLSALYVNCILYNILIEKVGTLATLIICALVFALIFSNEYNIFGMFIGGICFAYLKHISGSSLASVVSCTIFNITYMITYILVSTYTLIGVWEYLYNILIILFFISCIIYFTKLKKIEADLISFKKLKLRGLFGSIFSIGSIVFILVSTVKLLIYN